MRRIAAALLALLSIGLTVAACAPADDQPPVAVATPAPGSAPTAAATPQVEGARVTPQAAPRPTTQHEMLQRMDKHHQALGQMAAQPFQRDDLAQATEETTGLMLGLDGAFLEMDLDERKAALARMSDVLGRLRDLVSMEATQQQRGRPAGPAAETPGQRPAAPAAGALLALTPTPRGPLPRPDMLMQEVQQIRQDIRGRAAEGPGLEDTVHALVEIQEMLLTLHAQLDTVAQADAAGVVRELAGAMEDFDEMMRAYVRQSSRALPGQGGTPSRLP